MKNPLTTSWDRTSDLPNCSTALNHCATAVPYMHGAARRIIECLDLIRELLMAQPTISWPITPVKKQSPSKCHVLIEQELSEDSSDEEYQPNDEEQEQVFECRSLKNGTAFCSEVLCHFDLKSCVVPKSNL